MTEKPAFENLTELIEHQGYDELSHEATKEEFARITSILKATLESTADGIMVVDLDGRVISFNRRFQTLCGISDSLMKSMDDNQILAHFMALVKVPETFLDKVGEIYENPDAEVKDIIEFTDGRIFERFSRPQVLEGRSIGRVWSFRDITDFIRTENELRDTLKTLRMALGGTIQAIALTVEKRDPYTAGHQQRVSDLARSIATEMNLSKEVVDGIRLAGSIHDLGKSSIPTDILCKPGKLTEHEFGIIKTHPEVGFDILKGIHFPWSIAKTVLQHHERLDGSGYPAGLKGDEIIIEARVIAVADVVEAISSHRPYRPGLGMNVAISEINKGKGTIYDARVVDTCVELLTKKNFRFRFSNWNTN